MRFAAGVGRMARMALIPALVLSNCGSQTPNGPPFDGRQILFIGNSLTYSNDLPGMLGAMIDSAGAESTLIQSLALPDYGLADHWATGASAAIASRAWDIVVLQQGPSATEGRPSLLEFSRRFDVEVAAVGGRTAMYMVWPSLHRFFDFDGVSDSYRMAAEQVDGLLYPAGEAWRAAWRIDSTVALYDRDGFHPSVLGTYAAALVMFEQITGLSPLEAPRSLRTELDGITIEVPDSTANLLQIAAGTANRTFARP